MTYALSAEGRQALRALAAAPVLYAFDFDGTLAPLSQDRHCVKVPKSVAEWLKELSKRAPCAIVSGRSLADLEPRVSHLVPHLIGNHGIEGRLARSELLRLSEQICEGWKRKLTSSLATPLRQLDVDLEDKRYSLTFHLPHRHDPARQQVNRRELESLLGALRPAPLMVPGIATVNALPPLLNGHGGKGPAVLALMRHLGLTRLLYIGDEATDESVFTLEEGLAMGIHVGASTESRAQFYVKHQGEVEEVLRFLVHRLDRTPEDRTLEEKIRTDRT